MARGKSRTWSTGWEGKLRTYPDRLKREGAAIVREVAEEAAEDMRQEIATSGTGWEGREGRISTTTATHRGGRMYDAVDYTKTATWGKTRDGHDTRTASFGWLKDYEDYFYYQEMGFRNKTKTNSSQDGGPPGTTLPMQAYHQAFIRAGERLREKVRNVRLH